MECSQASKLIPIQAYDGRQYVSDRATKVELAARDKELQLG